jgi:LL-diaminopimelate aminotransferase
MINVERAERLKKLPPYLFKELDRKNIELRTRGLDIINLGVGDPDLPTPDHIIEAMKDALEDPVNHRYPSYSGMTDFKHAASEWFERRFGIQTQPELCCGNG